MQTTAPLNNTLHSKLTFTPDPSYSHSKDKHLTPITVHEFVAASQDFPVVFIKDNETGRFNTLALLGLKVGENLFYHDTGWQALYVPSEISCYPFSLRIHNAKAEEGLLCIDSSAPQLQGAGGEPLFDSNGDQTALTQSIAKKLADLSYQRMVTQSFVQALLDNKLLSASTLTISLKGEAPYELKGIYTIDEAQLNKLTDSEFCKLRQQGYLAPIYAALLSLQNVQKLIRLKQQR